MLSKMGDSAKRSRWRFSNANALAKPWSSTKREVSSGVVSGIAGGVWTAAVTVISPGIFVAIGAAIALAGAFAPWVVVYLFGLFTATGRDARNRLAVIEARLDKTAEVPPPAKRSLPDGVKTLVGLFKTGQLLLQRCPKGFKMGSGDPVGLREDIDKWVISTSNALEPWPEYRDQFSAPVADDSYTTVSAAEMGTRMTLLMSIINILAPGTLL
jgi:hypothetical protein